MTSKEIQIMDDKFSADSFHAKVYPKNSKNGSHYLFSFPASQEAILKNDLLVALDIAERNRNIDLKRGITPTEGDFELQGNKVNWLYIESDPIPQVATDFIPISEELPKLLETVWITNGNGYINLGCLTEFG